ncbi:unnamed protein product, partial [Rotaria sp. Silwood1]
GSAATKIQGAFRNHLARLRLKNEVTWKIHEKLEYSNEQTETKLSDMFEKLMKVSDILSPSVTKLLQKPGLPLVEANYRGPRKRMFCLQLMES